jgi:hypothetical protein
VLVSRELCPGGIKALAKFVILRNAIEMGKLALCVVMAMLRKCDLDKPKTRPVSNPGRVFDTDEFFKHLPAVVESAVELQRGAKPIARLGLCQLPQRSLCLAT